MAVLCLHLTQVNTSMLQEVLAETTWKAPMKPEDWRGLRPLFYQHVNPYGRFTLDLTKRLPLSLTKIAWTSQVSSKLCRTYLICGYEAPSLTQSLQQRCAGLALVTLPRTRLACYLTYKDRTHRPPRKTPNRPHCFCSCPFFPR